MTTKYENVLRVFRVFVVPLCGRDIHRESHWAQYYGMFTDVSLEKKMGETMQNLRPDLFNFNNVYIQSI